VDVPMIPQWWSEQLRERVADEFAKLTLHLGSHAPNIDDHVQPVLGHTGDTSLSCTVHLRLHQITKERFRCLLKATEIDISIQSCAGC
jgi:hypothetical protein